MTKLEPPAIEDLEAAYKRGRADFAAGGKFDRPPKFPHPAILNAWDKGFRAAEDEARK